MDIKLPYNLALNLVNFVRRCGYNHYRDPHTGQDSFTRRLSGDFYPRFHIYIEERDGLPLLRLHLDQKKPSYAGAHAHNAEYDGPTVEPEASRIQGVLANQLHNEQQVQPPPSRGFLGWFRS